MTVPAPVDSRPEPPVREYPGAYRIPQVPRWMPVIMVLIAVSLWFQLSTPLVLVGSSVDVATGRATTADITSGNAVGPFTLAANNVALALLIPIAMFLQWLFTGQLPGFLSSVRGRFRWGWALRAALVVVPLWGGWMLLGEVLAPSTRGDATDVALLIAITVLLTPLQAAGEEYGFRGLINRCTAAYFRNPRVGLVVGAVVSSLVFMLAHLATDPYLLIFYFGFGLIMCALAWRTGGLESGILVHALNNVVAFILTALIGDTDQVFQRGAGAGSPAQLISLVVGLAVALAVEWLARRCGLIRTGRPGVREEPSASVLALRG